MTFICEFISSNVGLISHNSEQFSVFVLRFVRKKSLRQKVVIKFYFLTVLFHDRNKYFSVYFSKPYIRLI